MCDAYTHLRTSYIDYSNTPGFSSNGLEYKIKINYL